MENNPLHHCRVCGFDHDYLIWGEDGTVPSFDICGCCGVEFGYEDTHKENCIEIRRHWIKNKNAKWSDKKERPKNWNLAQQIQHVPKEFQAPDDLDFVQKHWRPNVQEPKKRRFFTDGTLP